MKIGIIAVGSHRERHGAALPPDTDARIAEHIALKAARETGAEFLGTLKCSHELPGIETGPHESLQELIEELVGELREAKSEGFEAVLLVNAHGGNQELEGRLDQIEGGADMRLAMDSTICRIEGPHAGTGELSVGSVMGIADESRVDEHGDIDKYPEVGFAGFEEVREEYGWAEEHAREVIEEGVEIDESLGRELIESSVASAVEKVRELRSEE